jgi:protein-tyrosine phosphatase
MSKYSILFICMGNICRSPAAEGVMNHLLRKNTMADKVVCDSAGTINYHAGHPADHRMMMAAALRGVELTSRSRQIKKEDLNDFDLILTMDDENYQNVMSLEGAASNSHKVKPFCSYCTKHELNEVPDPYYGGNQGFELVLDMLEDGCSKLCDELKAKL